MNIAILILIVLGVIFIIIAFTLKNEQFCDFMLGLGIGILLSMTTIVMVYSFSVRPIDVYRGKTTLEITYKDSIPIDSTVVYKNK